MAEPRTRRPARPREEVFATARASIAEHGLAKLTMAGLGKQLQMSAGHLLYYFGSKDQLLLETLRWSEEQLGERRRAALTDHALTARQRLAAYAELYLPEGPGDPRWILWLEVWGRSPASAEIRQGQLEIEAPWQADLVALIEEGVAGGEFTADGAADRAVQLRALLDGLAVPVAIGLPGASRAEAAGQVASVAQALLGG
ncbi:MULTISPECIES: TetR/AcrR family transcriptional regulator [unclassified Kitasatospora]|uniref:TetR/AcrR family transcriptional regulator n=1 Tax=unclassified Kitasatospora TaxID=2633591 RepID=UPI00070C7CE0|nr:MULTISPECIES: TetR/AcrR family transcriptional regulator [unclassified Kitasatospora]KQV19204.1 transcriptional regulator [Kitasatospora sp. Root107]KRB75544.1 transcriptional regulator [Kitasatospora sp. Root187]